MKLRFSEDAREQQQRVDHWWRENRHQAPNLFIEELLDALSKIQAMPEVPKVWKIIRGQPIRRLLMRKFKQHVYYSVHHDDNVILIEAIWGARRGNRPPL